MGAAAFALNDQQAAKRGVKRPSSHPAAVPWAEHQRVVNALTAAQHKIAELEHQLLTERERTVARKHR